MTEERNMRVVSQDEFWNVFNYNTDFKGRSLFGNIWYFRTGSRWGERNQDMNGVYTYWMDT